MDPTAHYDINIDNNGDAKPDITFEFQFDNTLKGISLPIGGENIPVPVVQVGAVTSASNANQNVLESYTLHVIRTTEKNGKSRTTTAAVTNAATGSSVFAKPIDNIGNKTIADYGTYSSAFVYNVNIPGCSIPGRVFVGQRAEGFYVALGQTFDLLNFINPLGDPNAGTDTLQNKNITSLAIEIHKSCLATTSQSTVGVWTTSEIPASSAIKAANKRTFNSPTTVGDTFTQVSRLGMPLVNELVIGLPDKDKFNGSLPQNDAQFLKYVTNPTLPAIIQLLYPSVQAPTVFPRTDLVAAFLTGISGLNNTATPSEMLRLNTAIPATPLLSQSNLGVLGSDNAGFPNGRRVADDVVSITLRVAMGVLLPASEAPSGQLPFTDQVEKTAQNYLAVFPYLNTPNAGATTPAS
jgi:hypothetical protein